MLVVTSFTLPAEQLAAIKRGAKEREQSVSAFLRLAARRELARQAAISMIEHEQQATNGHAGV